MFPDGLRRVTRDGRWIAEIDGLRCLAIASVVLFHLSQEIQERSGMAWVTTGGSRFFFEALDSGNRGVQLFFVLSGLVLALPFARCFLAGDKPVSLRRYYVRRLTRLEPPYLVSIVLFLTLVAVYQHGLSASYSLHALASALYLHNLVYGSMSPVNPISWTLEVEVQFYVIAPLLMQVFRVRRADLRRVVLLAAIVLWGLALQHVHLPPNLAMSVLAALPLFLTGMLLADVYLLDLPRLKAGLLWDFSALLGLGWMFSNFGYDFTQPFLPFALAAICFGALRGRVFGPVFRNRWIAITGGMCYSIYLLHFFLIAVIFKVTKHLLLPGLTLFPNYLLQIVVTLLPVLFLCGLFFVLVERPCMDPRWPGMLWLRLTGRESHALDASETAPDTATLG